MSGFRELTVWRRAKALAVSIYRQTNEGAFARDYGLRDQLRRAAVSVPSTITEGDERDTNKESVRFLYIARGSLAEVVTQVEIAFEVEYFTKDQRELLLSECDIIGRMLGSLIKTRSSKLPITHNP
jgi:four helix bundle protein